MSNNPNIFKVTLLGTASAMPVRDRNQSAQALQVHGRFFLVDCGDGTQRQMVRCGIPLQRIDTVFISHVHGDHVYGLDAFLSTLAMGGRLAPLDIFGPRNLGPMLNFFLSYNPQLGFELRFHPLEAKAPEVILETKSFQVLAFPLKHGIETFGYLFREKEPQWNVRKEAIGGYGLTLTEIGTLKRGEDVLREDGTRIPLETVAYKPYAPRSYAYVSDTAVFPEEAGWLRGVGTLYHETTFLQECADKAEARFHSTTLQAAAVARDAGAQRLIIGHYSSRNQDPLAYEAECRSVFPETYAGADGQAFEI
ncbi:MAG: ribonuclease Z [Bacteroidales bacterium]|nr:ribonuclease Z [Bacteroidales bacterium]